MIWSVFGTRTVTDSKTSKKRELTPAENALETRVGKGILLGFPAGFIAGSGIMLGCHYLFEFFPRESFMNIAMPSGFVGGLVGSLVGGIVHFLLQRR